MPLSLTQQNVVDHLRAAGAGAYLRRYSGGYWAGPDRQIQADGCPEGYWVGTRTITALTDRLVLRPIDWTRNKPWHQRFFYLAPETEWDARAQS